MWLFFSRQSLDTGGERGYYQDVSDRQTYWRR